MVLKAIVTAIVKIIEAAAKIIYFLLCALRLWVPAGYSVIFLIVCLATGTPPASVTFIYLFGLGLSVLFAVIITVLQVMRARDLKLRERGGVRANVSSAKRRRDSIQTGRAYYAVAGSVPQDAYTRRDDGPAAPMTAYYHGHTPKLSAYPAAPAAPAPESYGVTAYPPRQQWEAQNGYGGNPQNGYPATTHQPPAYPPQSSAYQREQQQYFEQNGYFGQPPEVQQQPASHTQTRTVLPPPATAQPQPPLYRDEPLQPVTNPEYEKSGARVFRTRMDPKLLIYEYDDRLMFYKETSYGLVHLSTELK